MPRGKDGTHFLGSIESIMQLPLTTAGPALTVADLVFPGVACNSHAADNAVATLERTTHWLINPCSTAAVEIPHQLSWNPSRRFAVPIGQTHRNPTHE